MSENIPQLPCPPLPSLPPRESDSHKGTYGNALLIGGSRGMSGSIALAGLAALRTGAGLVRVAVPDRCLETVAGYSPCLMTVPLPDDQQGRIATSLDAVASFLEQADCTAVGPGMRQTAACRRLISSMLPKFASPVVFDADGLNNLAELHDWTKQIAAPWVLTPHPGEWARMSGVASAQRDVQIKAAVRFAGEHGGVVVLKGSQTVVTDGKSLVINRTGTPAMATGGTGDVLTGVITALICQGLAPRDAAHLGVHVHGMAGQLAAERLGAHVIMPTELIDALPGAFSNLAASSH